jgi:hypothetical protein
MTTCAACKFFNRFDDDIKCAKCGASLTGAAAAEATATETATETETGDSGLLCDAPEFDAEDRDTDAPARGERSVFALAFGDDKSGQVCLVPRDSVLEDVIAATLNKAWASLALKRFPVGSGITFLTGAGHELSHATILALIRNIMHNGFVIEHAVDHSMLPNVPGSLLVRRVSREPQPPAQLAGLSIKGRSALELTFCPPRVQAAVVRAAKRSFGTRCKSPTEIYLAGDPWTAAPGDLALVSNRAFFADLVQELDSCGWKLSGTVMLVQNAPLTATEVLAGEIEHTRTVVGPGRGVHERVFRNEVSLLVFEKKRSLE